MKTANKIIISLVAVGLVVVITVAVAVLANPGRDMLPEAITPESRCPIAGCTSTEGCHASGPYPELEEGQVMTCPSVTARGCESTECHAIDRATDTSRMPDQTSLYFWIVGLTVLTAGSLYVLRKR